MMVGVASRGLQESGGKAKSCKLCWGSQAWQKGEVPLFPQLRLVLLVILGIRI